MKNIVLTLAIVLLFAQTTQAELVFGTSFEAAEGFVDGNAVTNDANWYGQSTWTINDSGQACAAPSTFGRSANSNGALASLGNAAFKTGDTLTWEMAFDFTLGAATNTFDIMRGGMTSATSGTPDIDMGFKLQYNQFRGGTGTGPGSLKLYGDFAQNANAFALIVDADEFGMDPFGTSGAVDLTSDQINLKWEVIKTANVDEWELTTLSLDSFTYSGSQTLMTFSGADAFFAMQGTNNANATALCADSVAFSATSVPEPGSFCMMAIGLLALVPRRRNRS